MKRLVILLCIGTCTVYPDVKLPFSYGTAITAAQKGDWQDAEQRMQQLLVDNPQNPELLYDLGVACYNTKKFDTAAVYFDQVARSVQVPSSLKEQALFNKANTHVAQKKLPEAIECYQEVLTLNPDNTQAQHNLEVVKKMLKEQQKQQQQNKNSNKNEESQDTKDDSDTQDNQQNSQDNSSQDQDQNQSQNQEKQSGNQQRNKGGSSGGAQKNQSGGDKQDGQRESSQSQNRNSEKSDGKKEQNNGSERDMKSGSKNQKSDPGKEQQQGAQPGAQKDTKKQEQSGAGGQKSGDDKKQARAGQSKGDGVSQPEAAASGQGMSEHERVLAELMEWQESCDAQAQKAIMQRAIHKNGAKGNGKNRW